MHRQASGDEARLASSAPRRRLSGSVGSSMGPSAFVQRVHIVCRSPAFPSLSPCSTEEHTTGSPHFYDREPNFPSRERASDRAAAALSALWEGPTSTMRCSASVVRRGATCSDQLYRMCRRSSAVATAPTDLQTALSRLLPHLQLS